MKVVLTDTFTKSLLKMCRPWWHPAKLWGDFGYGFKCWCWKRYSTVRSRHLPHTWCDRRDLLAFTMFEILEQFIEKECDPGIVEWYGEGSHRVDVTLPNGKILKDKLVMSEMLDLRDWWNNEYHGRYEAIDKQINDELSVVLEQQIDTVIEDPDDPTLSFWDPRYRTPEAKARAHELYARSSYLENAKHNALQQRLHRLINIRASMWT